MNSPIVNQKLEILYRKDELNDKIARLESQKPLSPYNEGRLIAAYEERVELTEKYEALKATELES